MTQLCSLFIALVGFSLLAACNEEANSNGLVDYVGSNKTGSNSAYWLELTNIMNEWEKTVLVFGYADNWSACESLLGHAAKDAPERLFRCTPAN